MNTIAMNFDDNTDINAVYNQLKQLYPNVRIIKTNKSIDEILEEAEDEYLLALAEERLKNDNGVRYTGEEIRQMFGITQEEVDEMEDVEIE